MNIWLISGASLGHVLPAVSFFYGIASLGHKPILVLEDKGIFRRIIKILGLEQQVLFFPSVPSPRKDLIGTLRVSFRQIAGRVRDSLSCGDRILFFGSGLSLPFYWEGIRRGLGMFVHEQNVEMGMWNAFLSAGAVMVFAGFGCERFPFYAKRRCEVTGNLIVDFLSDLDPGVSFERKGLFRILVLGGTKGARALNYVLPQVLSEIRDEIEVIHLCGEDEVGEVVCRYNLLSFRNVKVMSWVFPVLPVMREADLVISRAGAMTLTEMCLAGVAGVVIPYPYARGHQYENARFLSSRSNLPWVDQRQPTWQEDLRKIILTLVGDRIKRMGIAQRLREALVWRGVSSLDSLLQ